jgi:hypothetical protein
MLEFTCSTCGKHVQADEAFAGKRVLCPACEAAMTAPTPASSAITTQPTIAQPTAASPGAFSEGLPPLPTTLFARNQIPRVRSSWLLLIVVGGIVAIVIAAGVAWGLRAR